MRRTPDEQPMPPPVAVIIPFYNGSDTIERAARSVLEQTVPPSEFVVVDDGSSETESYKLVEISKRLGFNVVRQENGGQGSARNAGVKATLSPLICFLDQDDFYLRHHIENLLEAMPENDLHFGWVYGELFEADKDGYVVRNSIVAHHASHPKTNIFELLAADMHVLPSAAMISREAFNAVGGFDPQFMGYEDDDLFLRLFRKGYTNYFTHKPVTVWCIHSESTSYGIRMARSRLRYFLKLSGMFRDDLLKGRFIVRDILIPRFHKTIIEDAIFAISGRGGKFQAHKLEYVSIANTYTDFLLMLPSLSKAFKRRVSLHRWIMNHRLGAWVYAARPIVLQARRLFHSLRK